MPITVGGVFEQVKAVGGVSEQVEVLGGVSEQVNDADDTAREICEKVRPEVESRARNTFAEFTPLKYRTQIVNGVNYFIKVRVGADQHIHIRAHKAFSGEVTYTGRSPETVHFQ